MEATPQPPPEPRPEPPPPDDRGLGMLDAARQLFDEGGDAARSALDTAAAVRSLAAAELALAKAALGRAAVFGAVAAVAALVGLFYLFATLAAVLVAFGLGWAAALAITAGAVLLLTGLLAWRVVALLKLVRFDGTRRQLERLREHTP